MSKGRLLYPVSWGFENWCFYLDISEYLTFCQIFRYIADNTVSIGKGFADSLVFQPDTLP